MFLEKILSPEKLEEMKVANANSPNDVELLRTNIRELAKRTHFVSQIYRMPFKRPLYYGSNSYGIYIMREEQYEKMQKHIDNDEEDSLKQLWESLCESYENMRNFEKLGDDAINFSDNSFLREDHDGIVQKYHSSHLSTKKIINAAAKRDHYDTICHKEKIMTPSHKANCFVKDDLFFMAKEYLRATEKVSYCSQEYMITTLEGYLKAYFQFQGEIFHHYLNLSDKFSLEKLFEITSIFPNLLGDHLFPLTDKHYNAKNRQVRKDYYQKMRDIDDYIKEQFTYKNMKHLILSLDDYKNNIRFQNYSLDPNDFTLQDDEDKVKLIDKKGDFEPIKGHHWKDIDEILYDYYYNFLSLVSEIPMIKAEASYNRFIEEHAEFHGRDKKTVDRMFQRMFPKAYTKYLFQITNSLHK